MQYKQKQSADAIPRAISGLLWIAAFLFNLERKLQSIAALHIVSGYTTES